MKHRVTNNEHPFFGAVGTIEDWGNGQIFMRTNRRGFKPIDSTRCFKGFFVTLSDISGATS